MKSVLVVDDIAFMRASLKMIIERNGFKVVAEADNGMTAVQKYKENRPDIVTMDITMPVCDGIKAVKMIKDFDSEAKIVMISNMGQEEFIKEAVFAGAKGFIVKPFREEFVVQALGKLFKAGG